MSDLRPQIRDHYDAKSLPAEKVAAILARGQAVAGQAEDANVDLKEKVVGFHPRWRMGWRQALAWAAALLVIAGLAEIWVRENRRVPFAVLAPRIVQFFGKPPELPKRSQDKTELKAWLVAQGAPEDLTIPPKLMPLESLGCQVVDVRGRPAWLTCFWTKKPAGAEEGSLVHLWVVSRKDFRNGPGPSGVKMHSEGGWSFAAWTQGEAMYTIALAGPMEKLTPYVSAVSGERAGRLIAQR